MEFEDMSVDVEWELRRLAALFGVDRWETREYRYRNSQVDVSTEKEGLRIVCRVQTFREMPLMVFLEIISTGDDSRRCHVGRLWGGAKEWICPPHQPFNELMARALYYYGSDVEGLLPSLTAHEKLELRLSMPREFWPQKWVAEGEV